MSDAQRQRNLVQRAMAPMSSTMSDSKEDAVKERNRATFCSENLCEYMHGGKEILEKRKELIQMMTREAWGEKTGRYYLNREEEYVAGLRGGVGMWCVCFACYRLCLVE